MTNDQVNLVNEIKNSTRSIIEKYMKEQNFDVANIVYCSIITSEELALQIVRIMKNN